jgi:hypothetical protein
MGGTEMSAADPNFIVRAMRPEEVEQVRTWEIAEGWNPGIHHGPCFFATILRPALGGADVLDRGPRGLG